MTVPVTFLGGPLDGKSFQFTRTPPKARFVTTRFNGTYFRTRINGAVTYKWTDQP